MAEGSPASIKTHLSYTYLYQDYMILFHMYTSAHAGGAALIRATRGKRMLFFTL